MIPTAEKRMSGALVALFVAVVIFVAGLFGWVLNIIKLIELVVDDKGVTVMFLGRAIGVVVPVIGAILGWF